MMSFDPRRSKEPRALLECMLGKDGVPKSGFDQTFYGLGVEGFHHHSRCDTNLFEESIDYKSHVAALWIKQERNRCQLVRTNRVFRTSTQSSRGRTQKQQFFVEQRLDFESIGNHRKRNETEVESPLVQSRDDLFGYAYRYADVGRRILLSHTTKRFSKF